MLVHILAFRFTIRLAARHTGQCLPRTKSLPLAIYALALNISDQHEPFSKCDTGLKSLRHSIKQLCCYFAERTALLADAANTQGAPSSASKRKPASASPGAIFAAKGKTDLTAGEEDTQLIKSFTLTFVCDTCMCVCLCVCDCVCVGVL